MATDPLLHVDNLLEAIRAIDDDIAGLDIKRFVADRRTIQLVERNLEIISEASRHLPRHAKEREPDIPWDAIAGIGNVLRHDYHRSDPGHSLGDVPARPSVAEARRRAHPSSAPARPPKHMRTEEVVGGCGSTPSGTRPCVYAAGRRSALIPPMRQTAADADEVVPHERDVGEGCHDGHRGHAADQPPERAARPLTRRMPTARTNTPSSEP